MIPQSKEQLVRLLEGLTSSVKENKIKVTQISFSGSIDEEEVTGGTFGLAFDMVDPVTDALKDALNEALEEREVNDED